MKLAFLVPHLGGSQTAFQLIYNINKHLEKSYRDDVVIFYENLLKPCYPVSFATINTVSALSYDGPVVATTLNTAAKLLNLPGVSKKIFYVVDMEWLYMKNKNYESLANIYQNLNIKLIARSATHAKCISNAWSRNDVEVIENFSIEKFMEISHGN